MTYREIADVSEPPMTKQSAESNDDDDSGARTRTTRM